MSEWHESLATFRITYSPLDVKDDSTRVLYFAAHDIQEALDQAEAYINKGKTASPETPVSLIQSVEFVCYLIFDTAILND